MGFSDRLAVIDGVGGFPDGLVGVIDGDGGLPDGLVGVTDGDGGLPAGLVGVDAGPPPLLLHWYIISMVASSALLHFKKSKHNKR